MSGEIQILLAALLSVAVGTAAIIYYLRRRKGSLPAVPNPQPRNSTTLGRDATALPKQETRPLSVSQSRDGTTATLPTLDEEVVQSAAVLKEHKEKASANEPEPTTEFGARPDERIVDGDLIGAPRADVGTAPAAARYKRVACDGHEPEATPSQVESETTSTPVDETAKEGAPVVERHAAVSDTLEKKHHKSGAGLHVPSGITGTGDALEQREIDAEHLPVGAGDEQVHLPAGSATLPTGSKVAIPSDVSAVSGEDSRESRGLETNQPSLVEQPSRSLGDDEAPGLADRDASVPGFAENVLSGDGASHALRGLREAEDPDGSPEIREVVRDIRVSRDEYLAGQMAEDEASDTEEDDSELDADSATITRPSQKKWTRRKEPRKYKGLARSAPQARNATSQSALPEGEEPARRERSLPIEVRLRFDRGGFCRVSLLPKRSADLPEDLALASPTGEVTLRAMQDEWYQDIVPEDISRVLQDGAVWTQAGASGQCTWSLSGRMLYVLADRSDISGYVSQACLDLGRDHVVLCSASIGERVQREIGATGARPKAILDESFGAPPGWVVFRGVVPNVAVATSGGADIFNALRPLPQIEISLERGIRLGHANWLHGYPPLIRVYGDPEHAAEVHIDGQVATCDAEGAYRVPGSDSLGSHTVWCSGTSKSYSIVPFDASWDLWEGFSFPVALGETRKLTVCGPTVRASGNETDGTSASIPVSETNPVLLGREPGQIVTAVRVSAQRGAPCLASPSFHPVWALQRDPLHCDKKVIRIQFVARTDAAEAANEPDSRLNIAANEEVDSWCRYILDASRKGMKTDPDTEPIRRLWTLYKNVARRLLRNRR